jgi:hypothetical protein
MVGWRSVWLAGWIEGTSWLSSQLSFDLVRELPQVGDSLVQIGKLSVDGANVCGSCESDHHTEFLERRFHGCSFAKMALVTAPSVEVIDWLFRYVISASIHAHFQFVLHESASDSRGYEHTHRASEERQGVSADGVLRYRL